MGNLLIRKTDTNGALITSDSAVFRVYRIGEDGQTKEYLVSEGIRDGDGNLTAEAIWAADISQACELYTSSEGVVTIAGVPYGTYYIEEMVAPEGYIAAAEPVEIILSGIDAQIDIVNRSVEDEVILSAVKSLTGATLKADQFVFQAAQVDQSGNTITDGYIAVAKNDAGGTVKFPVIQYTVPGTYYYRITEINEGKPGYKYDSSVYTVVVTAEDAGKGVIDAKISAIYKNGESMAEKIESVVFANSYMASGSLHLNAVKRMKSENTELGTFEFELKDEEGTVLSTALNDKSGVVSFDRLSFDQNDIGKTYTYTVSEKIPKILGKYKYDRTVYMVEVSIGDNGDGTLEISAKVNGEAYSDESIVFVNDVVEVSEDNAVILVTKKLTNLGNGIIAADQTYYVALYEDEECTRRISDIKPLEFKYTSVSTATFDNLEAGKTYYVGECDEAGNVVFSGMTADGTLYKVDFNQGNRVDVTKEGDDAFFYFENQYEHIPYNFYKGAELTITKKMVDSSGAAKVSDGSFYAGIFEDTEYTIPASYVSQNIVELPLNGTSEVSETIQVALVENVPMTLYVTEVDETGQAVSDAAGFGYTVMVESSEVTVSEDHSVEKVVITNREKEVSETPSPTPAPTATPSPGTEKATPDAAKTGDSTPVVPYTAAFLLAGAFIAWEGRRRKKGNAS